MAHRARALAILVPLACAGAAGARAGAQEPSQAPSHPAAPPRSSPVPVPSAADERWARLFLGIGYDLGGTKLVRVQLSDGTTPSIRASGGFALALGAELLPALQGRFRTRATVGLKYDAIRASNADLTYRSVPVEVAGLYDVGPVRLGAGLGLTLGTRLSGSGLAAGVGAGFDPSVGGLLLAEYLWRGGSGAGVTVGGRFLWQKLRETRFGEVVSANALGLQLAWIP